MFPQGGTMEMNSQVSPQLGRGLDAVYDWLCVQPRCEVCHVRHRTVILLCEWQDKTYRRSLEVESNMHTHTHTQTNAGAYIHNNITTHNASFMVYPPLNKKQSLHSALIRHNQRNTHFSHSNQNPIGLLGLSDWGLIFNVLALALMFTLHCGAQTAKVKADTTKGHNLRCHQLISVELQWIFSPRYSSQDLF